MSTREVNGYNPRRDPCLPQRHFPRLGTVAAEMDLSGFLQEKAKYLYPDIRSPRPCVVELQGTGIGAWLTERRKLRSSRRVNSEGYRTGLDEVQGTREIKSGDAALVQKVEIPVGTSVDLTRDVRKGVDKINATTGIILPL